ncbi:MAG: isoprenylcysteine carboxylmethyltransferase family protein [Candidatus Korobacteraceae bacterium]
MTDAGSVRTSPTWSRIARRIRVPLGFLFAAFYLWRARPDAWSLAVGGSVAALGVFLRAMASGHVEKNQQLAMTGPYAYSRNPLYLGSIIIAIGFAIASRDVWVAGGILIFFAIIYVPVIRSEEAFLRQRFGEYESYAQRVPRLLPRSLWLSGLTSDFSRELYLQHREYNALIGAAAMLAALVVKMHWFPHSW